MVTICRFTFMFLLGVAFFIFFGLPSYQTFTKAKTLLVSSRVLFDQKRPPAVTIYAWQGDPFNGWRQNIEQNWSTPVTGCDTSSGFDQVVSCIQEKTFNLTEVVDLGKHDLNCERRWSEEIGFLNAGKSYLFTTTCTISPEKPLIIYLKNGFNFTVFIHDKDYFIPTANPDVMPHILLTMDQVSTKLAYLKPVYYQMMDKPDHRCQLASSYSFTNCVKASLSKHIGCGMPWDQQYHQGNLPNCTRMDQLFEYDKMYSNFQYWEEDKVISFTGCPRPCSFTQYGLAAPAIEVNHDTMGLEMFLSRTKIEKRTEDLMLSKEAFVSQFGGALGLFIGFSFMSLWDVMQFFISSLIGMSKE